MSPFIARFQTENLLVFSGIRNRQAATPPRRGNTLVARGQRSATPGFRRPLGDIAMAIRALHGRHLRNVRRQTATNTNTNTNTKKLQVFSPTPRANRPKNSLNTSWPTRTLTTTYRIAPTQTPSKHFTKSYTPNEPKNRFKHAEKRT